MSAHDPQYDLSRSPRSPARAAAENVDRPAIADSPPPSVPGIPIRPGSFQRSTSRGQGNARGGQGGFQVPPAREAPGCRRGLAVPCYKNNAQADILPVPALQPCPFGIGLHWLEKTGPFQTGDLLPGGAGDLPSNAAW